ncbi:ABC transporter permease [Nocardioides sp. GXZ039]|uniref:ABC transporter permease n=1 Tax=Nocardioides sp. GXZ039 TaxID=3136018 RepID=UPI0030F4A6E8
MADTHTTVATDMRPPTPRKRRPFSTGSVVMGVVVTLICLFIAAPLVVVALASVTETGYLTFPPQGFSMRWYQQILDTPGFVDAFVTSLQLAAVTTVISVLICVPAAYAINRYSSRTTRSLEQVFLSPLILPAVVLGLGLLFVLSRTGWSGTFEGGVLAHVIIASPFVIRAVLAGMRRIDPRLEEASRSLGAGPLRTFFRVVVPSIGGSIVSGAVFAFVVSFDEAVVTLFITGPDFVTLPVAIFTYVQYSADPTVAAASTVLVAMSLVMVCLVMWLGSGEERREQKRNRP